jgi:hypothetical protein
MRAADRTPIEGPRSESVITRNAALSRLRRCTRWLIAGSLAVTGLLWDLTAQAFPGRTPPTVSGSGPDAAARDTLARHRPHMHHAHASLKPPTQAPASSSPAHPAAQTAASEAQASSPQAPASESASEPEPHTPVVSGGS